MKVRLQVSREVLEQMLVLGDQRRIVGLGFEPTDYPMEPTALVTFEIEAADAPDGAVAMSPILQRANDGTVTMLDPGWIFE